MYKIIGADGKEYGPASAEQLRQWLAEGRINAQTRIQVEGATDWKSLAEFPELAGPRPTTPPPITAAPSFATRPNIPNYLVQSILCTMFCCLPFGIPGIVFAAQVNTKLAAGDIPGAMDSSKKAKLWCWLSFGIGLGLMLIYFAFLLVAGVSSHRRIDFR